MAVELDICIQRPLVREVIVEQVKKELFDLLDENFDLVAKTEEPNSPNFRLLISDQAEVDVTTLIDPSDSNKYWATVSYAPLRTMQSKLLCIAVAIAVARLSKTNVVDDAEMLGLGSSISLDELANAVRTEMKKIPNPEISPQNIF